MLYACQINKAKFRSAAVRHWVCLLVLCCFVSGREVMGQTTGSSLQVLSERARVAIEGRKFVEAQKVYEQIVQIDPEMAEAYSNLGFVLYMQAQYREAIPKLLKALEIAPDLYNAQVILALSYFNNNELGSSLQQFEAAYAVNRSDLVVIQHLAITFLKLRQFEKAIVKLDEWLAREPNNADALFHKGQASLLLTLDTFEKLQESAPNSYRMHQLRAELFRQQGHVEPAIGEYKRAVASKPGLAGLHFSLGEIYWENKRLEEALTEFLKEAEISPNDPMTNSRLGNIYLQQGNFPESQKFLLRTLALQPDLVDAVFDIGELYRAQGKTAEAIQNFKRVIELDPERAAARYKLFELYRALGDASAATKEFDSFRSLMSKQKLKDETLKRNTQP
jgi:tetratricopeptide (TPR) repeat protein